VFFGWLLKEKHKMNIQCSTDQ